VFQGTKRKASVTRLKVKKERQIYTILGIIVTIKVLYGILFLSLLDINPGEEFYDEIAKNLLSGKGYTHNPEEGPNLARPPVYTLFLAGSYWAFGETNWPILLFQMGMDALTCLLVYRIASEIFGEGVGRLSAWGAAAYPFFTYYALRILSESLFTLLLALFVLLATRINLGSPKTKDFFLLGLVGGVTTLCKTSFLMFPFLAATGFILKNKARRKVWFDAFVFILTMLSVIAPWTIRNYQATGEFLLVGAGGGYNFWLGNHIPTDGLDSDELSGEKLLLLERAINRITHGKGFALSPENDRNFAGEAFKEIRQSPGGFVQLLIRKFFRFWFSIFHPSHKKFEKFLVVIQSAILIPAGVGTGVSLKKHKPIAPLLMVILYYVGLHTLTVATVRYSIPIMPYVIILAVYGLLELKPTPMPGFKVRVSN